MRPSPPAHSEGVTSPAPSPRCTPLPALTPGTPREGPPTPKVDHFLPREASLLCAGSSVPGRPSSHSHTTNLTRLAALSAWRPFPNQYLPVNSSGNWVQGLRTQDTTDPKTPVHGPASPRSLPLSSHPHRDSTETFTWNLTFRSTSLDPSTAPHCCQAKTPSP